MKRLSGFSLLSCALASGVLICAAFLGQNAVAESSDIVHSQTVQAASGSRFAQDKGSAPVTDAKTALEALIAEDQEKRAKVESAAGNTDAAASKGKDAPAPAVSKETLSLYPTAAQCGECHKQIYEEWSSSQHAYASISPMFHKFEQKFTVLTQGTVGTFCVRCHQQVGTQLGESRETPLWERSQISREGVTCITCHRVKEQYGKVNG